MAIISVSLKNETIGELDRLVNIGGYKGRSDAVKTAVHLLSREIAEQNKTDGKVSGILILVHDEKHEAAFSNARHQFEDLIKTLIHNQLGHGKCLELFLLEGEYAQVEDLIKACRKSGRAEYLKLITT
jgi:CopG family transcriptional regulator, nickel-responsive regulator